MIPAKPLSMILSNLRLQLLKEMPRMDMINGLASPFPGASAVSTHITFQDGYPLLGDWAYSPTPKPTHPDLTL